MRRKVLLGAATAVVVLAAAPLGLAGSDSFSDPRGDLDSDGSMDAGPRYDLVRATHGHTESGRLVHTVTVAGSASTGDLFLRIEDPEMPNGTTQCRWFVGRHDGRFGVFTCGYADRVGSARVRRISSSTVRFEFSPRAIDNTASYQWAAVSEGPSDGGVTALFDRLPSGDHAFITHRLR
jgi:hypothetical protein